MDKEKTFKTKTGFCHILPDKIVLKRDGIFGNIANVTLGNIRSRIIIIYGGLSLGLFYFAFDSYKNGQIAQPILFGILGIYLVYGVVNSINNSATPIKDRQTEKPLFKLFGTEKIDVLKLNIAIDNFKN